VSTPVEPTDPAANGQLLALLAESSDLDAFLNEVASLASHVVTPAPACGITVSRDGQAFTAAVSDGLAAQVDEIQYGADEGPCLDALRSGVVVQVDDLTQETRWPKYRGHAIAHGVTSSLSLPLAVKGEVVAALNLYSGKPTAFAGQQRRHAEAFAAQCAAALALALRQAQQEQVRLQLDEAMASRSTIDQAIGILMAQQRCTASTAFDLLRAASQHRNRKLRDVAADIIVNVTGQAPEPPARFRSDTGKRTA
jgi:GAF domain-containing protein